MKRLLIACLLSLGWSSSQASAPNVVFILTDNHGDWSLGCYGNKDIHTPNIDRLAAEGARFAHAFAVNPVCSPNRATLLTGLMPSQHGVHSYLGRDSEKDGSDKNCVISEWTTLGDIFHAQGYHCGMIGKWHLGGSFQPQKGFTDYWVTMPMGSTATFFNAEVIENGTLRREPGHLTHFWRDHALRFIEQQSAANPFFLYLPFNGPYGLGPAQEKDHGKAPHWDDYATATLPSFPRSEMHPWQFNNKDYLNNETCIRRYAAELTTLDEAIGTLREKLEAKGLLQNTLIIFTGDNGWSGGHHGLWGMGDHTRPKCAFDPTMTVPLIWWQPGKIKPGVITEHVSHLDFFPSLMVYLGLKPALPAAQRQHGHDYSPALRGQALTGWDNTIHYEYEDLRCVRTPTEKLIERQHGPLNEYYDLKADPSELHNLYSINPPTALHEQLSQWFNDVAIPEFDLWKSGRSKAKLLEAKP